MTAPAHLKPCPWCGASGEKLDESMDEFDAGHVSYIHCTQCGANGPSVYSEHGADHAISLAAARWNARAIHGGRYAAAY